MLMLESGERETWNESMRVNDVERKRERERERREERGKKEREKHMNRFKRESAKAE
jgi:hypothetical protein